MLSLQHLPLYRWLKTYNKETFSHDLIAGLVTAIVTVPQSMAYALLAGVPAEYGLYCSLLPLLLYALLGSSRSLVVGPAALISLMVASSIAGLAPESAEQYLEYAVNLSLLTGIFLLILRALRLGIFTHFISASVISGFTSAAAIVIAVSQLSLVLGIETANGPGFTATLLQLWHKLDETNPTVLVLSAAAFILLSVSQRFLPLFSRHLNLAPSLHQAVSKSGPILVVALGTVAVATLNLDLSAGVKTVGEIPTGLPPLTWVPIDWPLWRSLAMPAFSIALICFLTSVSVATTLAGKNYERIDSNQELLALGIANVGAAFSGTFALAGSISRSMVNHHAGAQTPIANMLSAAAIFAALLCLTPLFYFLPQAVLGVIVIASVVSMIELDRLHRCWCFNRADAVSWVVTFSMVLVLGVELGIWAGICCSIVLLVHRSSQPHIAIVGRVGNTEHFRNIKRHQVTTLAHTLAVRIDESLYFANRQYIENFILRHCAEDPKLRHLVLIFTSVNFIDTSALESLEGLIIKLRDYRITLHLAEVKGPVMDQLQNTDLLDRLQPGRVFFTTNEAMRVLAKT